MKIALTGSIAGGKSTVLRTLRGLGWLTVETDRVAAEIGASPEAMAFKRTLMGGNFEVAEFKRRFVAEPGLRAAYEAFVHPRVRAAWQGALAAQPGAHVVVELPLLYENKLEESFDKVVVLSVADGIARERWKAKGRDTNLFDELTKLLIPLPEKITRAHFVLDNNGSPDELLSHIAALHTTLITQHG